MKKKILSILLMGILMISLTGCGSNKNENNEEQSKNTTNNTSKNSKVVNLICDRNDDIKHTVKLVIENNILITKTYISSWDNKTEKTCTFYKEEAQKHNVYEGVSDSTDCDSTSGTRTTVFTLSEIDKNEVYLPETKFIGSNQEFDINGYKTFMENDDYSCVEE